MELDWEDSNGECKFNTLLQNWVKEIFLRRRAASALLIQNLEFQTILVSVCPMYGKNEQNSQNICVGHAVMLFAVFEQSIFKVPKKSAFAR